MLPFRSATAASAENAASFLFMLVNPTFMFLTIAASNGGCKRFHAAAGGPSGARR